MTRIAFSPVGQAAVGPMTNDENFHRMTSHSGSDPRFQNAAFCNLTKQSPTVYTALSWRKLNWFLTFFLATNSGEMALHKKSNSTIFLACEAGGSIKPGALAPGQRDVTNQARETGESTQIFKLSPASRAAHETAP